MKINHSSTSLHLRRRFSYVVLSLLLGLILLGSGYQLVSASSVSTKQIAVSKSDLEHEILNNQSLQNASVENINALSIERSSNLSIQSSPSAPACEIYESPIGLTNFVVYEN